MSRTHDLALFREALAKKRNLKTDSRIEQYLDDVVHDLKGTEASNINNEGASAQMAYILEACGNLQDALKACGL